MREILFRGKRIDSGEWIEGHYKMNAHLPGTIEEEIYSTITEYRGVPFIVDPVTIGQYTGLRDKKGKRIFEGDICRNTRTGEIVSVKWHGTMAGYVWSKRRGDNSHLSDFGELFRAFDKYEVIGNIHDNPELLEG